MLKRLSELLSGCRWIYHSHTHNRMHPDELWVARLSFSQFGEDLMLDNVFSRNGVVGGFYVEVGAFDPFMYSNTYFFYKKGWRGLLVEPNPTAYKRLCELRPRDTVINTAISSSVGVLPFVVDNACSGVLDESYTFRHKENQEVIEVPCSRLSDILGQYAVGVSIDFLSVDCEGHDLAVLKSNDWSRFRPKVVSAEDHEPRYDGPIHDYMVSQGYVYLCKLGPSFMFREKEFVLKVH